MKLVKAFVKANMLHDVTSALHKIAKRVELRKATFNARFPLDTPRGATVRLAFHDDSRAHRQ